MPWLMRLLLMHPRLKRRQKLRKLMWLRIRLRRLKLRQLRQTSHVPVIVISAKGQDPEKILGLNLGADDYLVKPFNPLEAVARVGALLRRLSFDRQGVEATAAPVAAEATSAEPPLVVGDLRLDRDGCTLERAGEPIALTSVEYRIMELLMEHPGRVFTKAQIYEAGYSMEKAVKLARDMAKAPQVVLLSPACASFDMYDNMAERGRDFKRLVNALH